MHMPALSLAAVPGRRKATIELAKEIERRGYSGIYLPSFGDAMGLGVALALETEHIPFGTTVQPIYLRQPSDFAGAGVVHPRAQRRALLVRHRRHARTRAPAPAHHARQAAVRHPQLRRAGAQGVAAGRRRAAADRAGDAARQDGRAVGRDRRGRGLGERRRARAWRHRSRCCPPTSANERRLLHRRHDPDLHQRRPRGRRGRHAQDAHRLRRCCRTTATTGSRPATKRRCARSRTRSRTTTSTRSRR